ncbi:integrase arm-type DNA-binding domain-containing protein [Brevundimonas sp. NPDC046655]|uniref:integrase arm-type DNA-binding domain-containing protein n=1 Tax=unclassified Brevundimonas TaxID=2622653 RepID=UPI00384FDBB7
MSDPKLNLTDRNLLGLAYAREGQYRVRDTETPGFFVLIGSRTKSFMIQSDLRVEKRRVTIRMKVAEVGEISAREARSRAKGLLARIAAGEDPRPPRVEPVPALQDAGVPTLREAWSRFKASHLERKGRAYGTFRNYTDHMERLFADWLDQPLSVIGEMPRLLADRHDHITRHHGPAIANGAVRSFRAVYNHARKTCRQLPAENPAIGVDWNPDRRKNTAMGAADLPTWFEQAALIPNPIRREFQLLTLLSGSRPEALKNVRVEDLDLRRRIMHIRLPKGGPDKAFDVPLSRAMLESVFRLRRIGPVIYPQSGREWLFPSDAACGHMTEHKEKREALSHYGNDLRQTYRTLGQAAEVSEVDMHLLMNHSLPGVNAGYITRSKLMRDHLRAQQERLSQFIVGSAVGRGRRPSAELSRWLNSTSRMMLQELLDEHPDTARLRAGPRSALRRLEVQAARMAFHELPGALLDAPSRRSRRYVSN